MATTVWDLESVLRTNDELMLYLNGSLNSGKQ